MNDFQRVSIFMTILRKIRTFTRIFRNSPRDAWDVLQLKVEVATGKSTHLWSSRRRATRRFEAMNTEPPGPHLTAYGNYLLDASRLPAKPIVFSAGVGEFIDFDLALLDRHDVQLVLIDPTPFSKRFIDGAGLPPNAVFCPVAIADLDGQIDLFADNLETDVQQTASVSSIDRGYGSQTLTVDCRRVKTLMEEQGVDRLDVLKLDIEGAAVAALRDTLAAGIYPTQIAAEFERPRSRAAVRAYLAELTSLFSQMRGAGYRCYRTRPDLLGFQVEILAVRDDRTTGT